MLSKKEQELGDVSPSIFQRKRKNTKDIAEQLFDKELMGV